MPSTFSGPVPAVRFPARRQPVIELEPSRHYEGEYDLVMGSEHMTHRTAMTPDDLAALASLVAPWNEDGDG